MALLDCFLLMRAIEFLGANVIFTVRILNVSLFYQAKSPATEQTTPALGPSIYRDPLKSPQNTKRHTKAEANHSQLLRTV